jgi:ATP-dependent phosphofructokinase / diphosphate-dependent phosphofructokinase
MAKLEGKVLIAQGGGPTAVINQSLIGVAVEARKFPQVTRIYGAINGVRGITNEDFIDLTQETTNNLEKVALTPSSALLSTRDKPDEEYCSRIFKVLKVHDVRYFFYIGGNDSADTVNIVNRNAEQAGYDMRSVHIPKTIDNDLVFNDHTPGYPSAARFVALAFMGANLDNRSLPGVYIAVVMGRHAGFLTAASSLGRAYPDDGPHLIYLPERSFDPDKFLGDVDRVYKKLGRCVVAVCEGITDEKATPIVTKLTQSQEKDAHGNIQLSGTGALGDLLAEKVKKKLKISRVRADTYGYLQRCYMGVVSDVDQNEAREVGERAAQYALWHDADGSVTIHRTGNYSVDYQLSALSEIAARTKTMPDEFINEEANDVTEAFYAYARPLLGSGMPQPHRLRAPQVTKLLK